MFKLDIVYLFGVQKGSVMHLVLVFAVLGIEPKDFAQRGSLSPFFNFLFWDLLLKGQVA